MIGIPLRESTDEMLRQAIGRFTVDLNKAGWASARYRAARKWLKGIHREFRRRDREAFGGYAQWVEYRLGDPGDER